MENSSRRSFLKTATLLAGIAAVPVSFISQEALAAKMAKAALQYQEQPKGDLSCIKCIQFIPGETAKANGTCKIVEGTISPHGWCLAFSPKPA